MLPIVLGHDRRYAIDAGEDWSRIGMETTGNV